jgi:hypothetical protein
MSRSSVNGIPLIRDAPSAGAVFEIDRPAASDLDFSYDGGWSLQAKSGERLVVVRGSDLRDFRPLFASVPAAASRGLDLLCVTGGPAYALSKVTEEGIYFWPRDGDLRIHWYGTLPINVTGRASLTVGGAVQGRTRVLNHHPSFAYFRRSQTETDLGDSYRHAYLALESLLDSIAPHVPGQPEAQWLLAALAAANGLVASGTAAPAAIAAQQYTEWYDSERNFLFHSKSSRSAREPALTGDAFKRLLHKKNSLLTFYVAVLGAPNISGGGLTHAGLESILARYDSGDFTARTEDDADPPNTSSAAPLLREPYGQPNGEGRYLCRDLPVPETRRVKKWWAILDGEKCIWCDFAGALEVGHRDELSAGLQIENRASSFRNRFLT